MAKIRRMRSVVPPGASTPFLEEYTVDFPIHAFSGSGQACTTCGEPLMHLAHAVPDSKYTHYDVLNPLPGENLVQTEHPNPHPPDAPVDILVGEDELTDDESDADATEKSDAPSDESDTRPHRRRKK